MLINIKKMTEFITKDVNNVQHNKITSIIIVLIDRENIELIKTCIRSIKDNTIAKTYEIITVIGLDKEGHIPWIQQHSDIVLLYHHKSQENIIEAYNKAMEIAKGQQILLLDPYTMVKKHWLDNMLSALYSKESMGGVVPLFKIAEAALENNEVTANERQFGVKSAKYLPHGCFIMKAEILEKVGYLDPLISVVDAINLDYSCRIMLANYKLGINLASTVCRQLDHKMEEDNGESFLKKWGMSSRQYKERIKQQSNLWDILQLELLQSKKKVLIIDTFPMVDIMKLMELDYQGEVFGLTRSSLVAKLANRQFNIDCVASWNDDFPYKDNCFDLIYLPEEWSQIYQPEDFLQQIRRILKIDGKFVFKVKNALFYKKIANLIKDQAAFTEEEYLYTCHDVVKLLQQGFYDVNVQGFFVSDIERQIDFFELQSLMAEEQRQFIAAEEFYISATLQG